MRRWLRPASWLLVAGLLCAPLLLPRSREAPRRPASPAARLLGPIASVAASVQWVRVHEAMAAGRSDLALARARTALALDPGATDGWIFAGGHLALVRASAERESDPGRRLAWLRAGLELARRGEAEAREPAQLALWQGLVLANLAQQDDPPPWPGGPRGLWLDAAAHFERAARMGLADGGELAARARERAE